MSTCDLLTIAISDIFQNKRLTKISKNRKESYCTFEAISKFDVAVYFIK